MKWLQTRRRAPGRSAFWTIGVWTFTPIAVAFIFRLLWRLKRYNRHRVPSNGPIVYVSNHQSHFDPPLVSVAVFDRPCAYMARASLFAFKPFGAFIRWLGAIPLARKGADTGPLRNAIETLQDGRGVLIFPEGTRTRDGSVGEFKSGFLFLARRTGAAIVPVAIEGAHEIWPPGRKWPRITGRIHVAVAEPLTPTELESLSDPQAVDLVRRRIEQLRLVHRDMLRQQSKGRYPPAGAGDRPFWEQACARDPAAAAIISG